MVVNRQELIDALESVNRVAINSKGDHPCYYFTGKAIESTNFDNFISVPFETDFTCTVTVRKLLPFLKTLTSETVKLESTEDNPYLKVSFGRMSGTFATSDAEIPWPELEDPEELPVPTDVFTAATNRCSGFVTDDSTRLVLTGVNIATFEGNLYASATDGRRLFHANMGPVSKEYSFIIPPPLLRLIAQEEVVDFAVTANTISFWCKSGVTYVGRIIIGEYPNVRQVIPTNFDNHVLVEFPDDLKNHLHRAILLGATSVTLDIAGGVCTISANTGYSEYEEAFAVIASGDVKAVFNPVYMTQLIALTTKVYISATAPSVAEAERSVSVLMPLRQN